MNTVTPPAHGPDRQRSGCPSLLRSMTVAAALAIALAVSAAPALAAPTPGTPQTFTYGTGAAAHPYIVYTPKRWTPGDRWPLLVMVHGCQTTAEQQMEANLYNPLADAQHFVVMYPDTDAVENAQPGPLARCWQFFSPGDWERGQGDPAVITAITQDVMGQWNIDPQRVYVMGMSAGAFMSSDLAAEYPDVYAASGENAGSGYANGLCVFQSATSLPASVDATMAFDQEGSRARVVPRFVIGGDADQGIPPACADEALEQGLRTNNLVLSGTQTAPISLTPASVTSGQVPNGYSYKVSNYLDGHGCLIGQRVLVHGMNHFWSGGSSDPKLKAFTDPKGPSAAVMSWAFFKPFTLANTADACAPTPKAGKPSKKGSPARTRHRRKRRSRH